MPYTPPILLFNPHLETIYPSLFRKVVVPYQRERINTPDNDFLDLDWLKQNSESVAIISHGLEGNTHRTYMQGMARAFYQQGFDVLAWNYRGCSEEMNRQLRFYHSGATDDLDWVVKHASQQSYKNIYLVGFSLGGNLTLKYLGERKPIDPIKKAVVFSVPMHLSSGCKKISQPSNIIYSLRFLRSLRRKVKSKASLRTDLDIRKIDTIKTLLEFDDHFTAPLHGFTNAEDYYEKNSSLFFVEKIQTPTLIVSALNDPFLSAECYPMNLLRQHAYLQFETPGRGGHVGFAQFNQNGLYWSEQRALAFIQSA
ncbi:MAG: alpha/beta fold hydrolase [Flammeovirgaceae bacterium]|nr:alpha/beta fold hydrolase [Flammeovirgaceae bacterium]